MQSDLIDSQSTIHKLERMLEQNIQVSVTWEVRNTGRLDFRKMNQLFFIGDLAKYLVCLAKVDIEIVIRSWCSISLSEVRFYIGMFDD